MIRKVQIGKTYKKRGEQPYIFGENTVKISVSKFLIPRKYPIKRRLFPTFVVDKHRKQLPQKPECVPYLRLSFIVA